MDENEMVRVRTANGFETNVPRIHAEASDDLEILEDQPDIEAVHGRVLRLTRASGRRIKPGTTVAKKATAKKAVAKPAPADKAVTPADDTKEQDQ